MIRLLKYAILLLFYGCAQIVAPTGGPKDEAPPEILSEVPSNLSTDFDSEQIVITFNEFIQLNSPAQQVLISPPVRKMPDFKLKRKSLLVEFAEELRPNTTYTINFGEAIKDYTEGNILKNYTYVFSTGEALDSMMVKGKLTDAFTGEPEEGALVMLYMQDVDSLPLDTTPDYFTRTDESGAFTISNVADSPYRIFALQDQNSNYRFDIPDEKIGFLDTLIVPYAPPAPRSSVPDTLASDSIPQDSLQSAKTLLPTDSTAVDSGMVKQQDGNAFPFYELRMFVEEDTTQFLKKSYCEHYGKFVFTYNLPVRRFSASVKDVSFKKQWGIIEYSASRDTVTVWSTAVPDTFTLHTRLNGRPADTMELVNKPRTEELEVKGKGKGARMQKVRFALTGKTDPPDQRSPEPGAPLQLIWSHPATGMNVERIFLWEDSVSVPFRLTTKDTSLRRYDVHHDWKNDARYDLLVLDSAFTDIYDLWNDTLRRNFTGKDGSGYGTLSLKVVAKPVTPLIIDLLNSSNNVVSRTLCRQAETLRFTLLTPGKYSISVIDDENGNGRWDSGRYLDHRQPEVVRSVKTGVEVRANWEMELEWDSDSDEQLREK